MMYSSSFLARTVCRRQVRKSSARWRYAMGLVGLALLNDEAKSPKGRSEEVKEEEAGQTIEAKVERFTRALAPVLLPMIDALGALELENVLAATASGEAV